MKTTTSARPPQAIGPASKVVPHLEQAYQLLRAGRLTEAELICRAVLDRNPNHPFALDIFGLIAHRQDATVLALTLFQKAITADARQPVFRQHLASLYFEMGRVGDAVVQLRKALKLKPDFIEASCDLGKCYLFQGKFDEAIALFRKALATAPDNPSVIFESASGFAATGLRDEAKALLCHAIEKGIEVPNAYFELTKLGRPADEQPDLDAIEARLGDKSFSTMQRSMLHLAAGNVAARRKLNEEAFEHFRQAKAPYAHAFDIKRHREMLERLRDTYTRTFFEDRAGFGNPSERPVFIVGMPRSGTSLTEQILASHAKVAAGGELSEMGRIAASIREDSAGLQIASLSREDAGRLAEQYLELLQAIARSAPRVTDKMPHNFLHLGLIGLLFPNAKIIHCRRSPLDNCLSCFMTGFPGTRHAYTAGLDTLGAYYVDYVALMDHWRAVLPVPIFELRYENLIAEPETQIRAIVEHIGLEWDPACLKFHDTARVVRTASRYQATQPIYRGSVGRWRDYEHQLGPLKDALGPLAEA